MLPDLPEIKSEWTRVDGGLMHSRGSARLPVQTGPTVILVPGMIIASSYMVPTAKQLAPLCRVHAVDLPGFGRSYKPRHVLNLQELSDALAQWMDAMALPKAHLVANSFGCQILAEFSLRHPQRVDRLVLQGPTVDPSARSFLQQLWRIVLNSRNEPKSLGWISIKDYWAAGIHRARKTIEIAIRDKIEEKLPRISMPTLVVGGDKDLLVPQRWAEEVAGLLPRGELQVIPGAAHTLNYAAPIEFVHVMRPFLRL